MYDDMTFVFGRTKLIMLRAKSQCLKWVENEKIKFHVGLDLDLFLNILMQFRSNQKDNGEC